MLDRLSRNSGFAIFHAKTCFSYCTPLIPLPSRRWRHTCESQVEYLACSRKDRQQPGSVQACNKQTSRSETIETHPLSLKYPQTRCDSLKLAPRHFINLTNGVEALSALQWLKSEEELRFTRIQSSHCESSAYNKMLAQADNELLFALACGRNCYVYDFASRSKLSGVPRALYLGVQFIKWSLAYLWFSKSAPELIPDRVMVRGKNLVPFWHSKVMPYQIDKDTKQMIRYYMSFAKEMGVREIKLHGVYGKLCEIDGCKEIHVKMVRDWLEEKGVDNDSDKDVVSWIRRHGFALYDSELTLEQLLQTQRNLSFVSTDSLTAEENNES